MTVDVQTKKQVQPGLNKKDLFYSDSTINGHSNRLTQTFIHWKYSGQTLIKNI